MRLALVLSALLLSTACVSIRDTHGYAIERGETELTALEGIDTKESVLARFGEPSVRPSMSDDVWYYISTTTNSRAFYQTETTSRDIIVFAFNEDGTVADVLEFDLEDGQQVAINDRVTRTRGKELSFLEQLIGGVGKGAGAVDPDNAPQ
ncbi:outer membrane protein assembly factor BamE domain-containing protein [Parvularcula marina]|uniref:Outer membrane protein assembly factor BamE n=1 Tax=Parvularcula marina TaxID=2292771 RepID=A0A371RGV5_9PROT|nr:outer membrane protein assembly factor BamE [Parvularcula marina]RFB04679.1 outer membrane protein assembly factor BamE [Parvularcula marina]